MDAFSKMMSDYSARSKAALKKQRNRLNRAKAKAEGRHGSPPRTLPHPGVVRKARPSPGDVTPPQPPPRQRSRRDLQQGASANASRNLGKTGTLA